jgi:hypothetical protein
MISWLLAATLLAVPSDLASFEKILIPTLITFPYQITGTNGSQFRSSASLLPVSSPVRAWLGGEEVELIERFRPIDFPGTSRAGRILFLERSAASSVSLGASLSSSTDGALWHATTLPIVRERDYRTGPSVILNIASTYFYTPDAGVQRYAIAQFRHHLRIYDADARGNAQVRVRRLDQSVGGTFLLEERVITLDQREGSDPTYPAFAEMLIPELCHPFSQHTPCMGGVQWVEIEPLTPGLRYFPIVSATDNLTQQVTVQWPQ